MARAAADVRISLKKRGGKTYRVELIRHPSRRRFRVRRNGRLSKELPEATATEIAEEIRKWLSSQLDEPDPELVKLLPPEFHSK